MSYSAVEHRAKKAEAVLKEEDMQRVVDLGLGRGVDATDPRPWTNKTSFQVRRVSIANAIGTEEGGALQSYETEISSVKTRKSELKASTREQLQVSVGVDAETSCSATSTRRVVGKKVVNRTISFKADFDDAPHFTPEDGAQRLELAPQVPMLSHAYDKVTEEHYHQQSLLTFEERLCLWLMKRILHRRQLRAFELGTKGKSLPRDKLCFSCNPVTDIAEAIATSTEEERKEIQKDCQEFVKYFRVTHYISAIELGAMEYRVFSETDYYKQVGLTGTLGISTLADTVVKERATQRKLRRASELKRIGTINEHGAVVRGTYDEAVVGVAMQPITTLVRQNYLRLALTEAVCSYMDEQEDSSDGPFLISCGNNKLFLTVNQENAYALEATEDINKASQFYIMTDKNNKRPYRFLLGCYNDGQQDHSASQRTVDPLMRYLTTPITFLGHNSSSLRFKLSATESNTQLTIHSRLVKKYCPQETSNWQHGKDMVYINCAHKAMQRDSYICVKSFRRRRRRREDEQVLYSAGCVPSKKYHNDQDTWMLFRLLRPHSVHGARSDKTDTGLCDRSGELSDSHEPTLQSYERMLSRRQQSLTAARPAIRITEENGEITRETEREDLGMVELEVEREGRDPPSSDREGRDPPSSNASQDVAPLSDISE